MPAGKTWLIWTALTELVDVISQRIHTTPQLERLAASGVITRTAYYGFGGQRVAMRVYGTWPGNVYWLHGDHLGSANLTTDAAGNPKAEQRYYPFGETRWVSPTLGTLPTDRRFTGQLELAGLGIYDYGARADSYIKFGGGRWYSPLLGRFINADSIVPRPGDPQSLNRYAYVRNSPISRVDPSGHIDLNWLSDFAAGFGGALLGANISLAPVPGFEQRRDMADALFVAPGTDTNSDAYAAGRIVGDVAATAQGIIEMVGGGISVGGGAACLGLTAGACAPITAAAVVAGTIEFAHGATVAGTAASDATALFAKRGNSNTPRSSSRDIANRIGNGHAYDEHVVELKEFEGLGIDSRERFSGFIQNIMDNATGSNVRNLSNGRIAYWDDASQTVVIYNPQDPDWGTAFFSDEDYFNRLR